MSDEFGGASVLRSSLDCPFSQRPLIKASRYVNSLKRRVEQLEQNARDKRARISIPSITQSSPATSPTAPAESGDGHVRATMGEIGFLSRSAMSESRNDRGQFPRKLRIENVVIAAVKLDGRLSHHFLIEAVPASAEHVPLQREPAVKYVEQFFDQMGFLLLHLDRASLMEQCEAVLAEQGREADAPHDDLSLHIRNFEVYLAVAIGALVSSDTHRVEVFVSSIHSVAMGILTKILKAADGFASLRCMLLLILYSVLNAHGGSPWYMVGLANSLSVSLALHKEPDHDSPLSAEEKDAHRKLFWSLYVLDRCALPSCFLLR